MSCKSKAIETCENQHENKKKGPGTSFQATFFAELF